MPTVQEFHDTSGGEAVRGFLHTPDAPSTNPATVILTHSAGSNCRAPVLVALADAFAQSGLAVLRCDLPFRQARATGPPLRTAMRDQAGLRAAVEAMRRHTISTPAEGSSSIPAEGSSSIPAEGSISRPAEGSAARIFLGGHSYGGRMASMLAADEAGLVDALLLLSYPLHPPKQPQQMRTQHFPHLETPALFVSGTHDGFGSIPELASALPLIPARTRLLPVEGAGHELLSKRNEADPSRAVVEAFLAFIALGS
jgi:predicted alpha/beta-hydrolase family hydrolase